ncbi:MAG TPA: NAD(P)H-dependent oxidoreductase [Candidatus Paceibacterota bacterium]|nr:NAD(P)H-dependent oxidoreductase [Verrucomicrobiota bacterium]HRY52166.1 NAD(P)H-dependent oxidoreductase [Candidatus Paceibacterota bacterium]
MKYSVILAHPTPGSFNHAIAETVVRCLRAREQEVFFHDLYAENFDPVMPAREIARDAVLDPVLERHCDEIGSADGIVIVHPNWWSQPPAILKGWVDRALRAGRAYTFVAGENGEGKAVGLLKAKTALVITTANTPQEKEVALLGDPLGLFWEKVVCGLCGIRDVRRLVFTPVIISQPEQRAAWLRQVETATFSLIDRLP